MGVNKLRALELYSGNNYAHHRVVEEVVPLVPKKEVEERVEEACPDDLLVYAACVLVPQGFHMLHQRQAEAPQLRRRRRRCRPTEEARKGVEMRTDA